MNRPRTLVALIASFSLMCSGCCLVQVRKDTGEAYVLPVRQWSWMEWGCVALIGCIAFLVAAKNAAPGDNMPARD